MQALMHPTPPINLVGVSRVIDMGCVRCEIQWGGKIIFCACKKWGDFSRAREDYLLTPPWEHVLVSGPETSAHDFLIFAQSKRSEQFQDNSRLIVYVCCGSKAANTFCVCVCVCIYSQNNTAT